MKSRTENYPRKELNMELNNSIAAALTEGEASETERLVRNAVEEGANADDILGKVLLPAMDKIGNEFEKGDLFLPELIVAAEAMKAAMSVLAPHLKEGSLKSSGKVILGTVWKDLHDIGKNLLKVVLEGDGFEVVDLGASVAPGEFLATLGAHPDANVLGMSALLTTTMKHMKTTVDVLKEAGIRDKIKVIVGGAPVTEEFAMEIGADAYASDANAAKLRIRELCIAGEMLTK